jgi:Bifunctional DNA primase/polymerase, N-terminal
MTRNYTLDAALALAADGYPVFPCTVNKTPTCRGGFHSAKADRYAIEELWQSSPGDLIGVPTGLVFDVLDIDAKHEAARDWWNANRRAMPRTRAHRTRSGGLHLLFQANADVACNAGKLAPGVDVRGRGGYIVWWPAHHFPVLSDAPLAPWPDWLLEQFQPKPRSSSTTSSTISSGSDAWLRGLVRTVANAAEGQRNHVLFWAACRAGEAVREGAAGETFVIDVLIEAAARAGLPEREAQRTIQSGMNRHG